MSVPNSVSQARRAAGASSIEAFGRLYLAHHFRDPPSPMHAELFELLGSMSEHRGRRIAIAAPRGHAKSTIAGCVAVLWNICYGREPYILMFSNTAEQAQDQLSFIKHELSTNARLLEDFPECCETDPGPQRWRRDEIITNSGVKVTALGADKKIRGRRHNEHRPSLLILDDVENETEVRSPDQREYKRAWFEGAVLKAGDPKTNVIVIGTVLHYDSLLASLLDPDRCPGWETRKYQAVTSWATRTDLWERFERVFCFRDEHEGRDGPEAARAFFDANREAMLEGAATLWPERESYLDMMELRLMEGRASFNAEKQNEPVNPEDCYFQDSDFVFWDDQWEDETQLLASLSSPEIIGACDPSLGKQGRHRDDTAIVTIAHDTSTGVMYVLDADIARRKPDQIIEAVIEYQRLRGYARFSVETNQFQEFLADEVRRRSGAAGVHVPVHDIKNTTDKLGRIQSLQPLISSGRLRLSRRHVTLLEQLRQFPHAAHDDGPDALQMAVGHTVPAPLFEAVYANDGPSEPLKSFAEMREDPEWAWRPLGRW